MRDKIVAALQYMQLRIYGALTAVEQDDYAEANRELEAAGKRLHEAVTELQREADE